MLGSRSRAACSRQSRSPPATERGRAAPSRQAVGRTPVSDRNKRGNEVSPRALITFGSMAKLGPRVNLGVLVCAAAAIAVAAAAGPGFAQDESFQDLNSIIRGLALIEYLPEHAGRPSIDLDVRFRLGSAELTEAAMRQLDELAAAMRAEALAESRFRIAGHTDATGAASYNLALSRRRAAAVRSSGEPRIRRWRPGDDRIEAGGHPLPDQPYPDRVRPLCRGARWPMRWSTRLPSPSPAAP